MLHQRRYPVVILFLVVFCEMTQGLGNDALSLPEDRRLALSYSKGLFPTNYLTWTTCWMLFLAVTLGLLFVSLPKSKPISLGPQEEAVHLKKLQPAQAVVGDRKIPPLDLSKLKDQPAHPSPVIDPFEAGYRIRPISPRDFKRGYVELLQQAATMPQIGEMEFARRIKELNAMPDRINLVVEHSGQLVGSGTLYVSKKPLLVGERTLGVIDEVVVDKKHRRKRIGSFLLKKLAEEAKDRGCMKISLDTDPKNQEFYNRAGFESGRLYMTQRI